MSNSRIPRVISELNSYIRTTDTYLHEENPGPPPTPNWQRLGLTEPNATSWHNARQTWESIYAIYEDPNTRTKAVTANLHTARESFIAFAQPLLDIMAASPNADDGDEVALNFKIGRKEPSHPTVPIAEICIPKVEIVGQGVTKFVIRTDEDRRPAMAPGANIIQMVYKVSEQAPLGPSDGTTMVILGKATDKHNFGDENIGKRCWVWFRYFNTKYPHLAGDYCTVQSFVIS